MDTKTFLSEKAELERSIGVLGDKLSKLKHEYILDQLTERKLYVGAPVQGFDEDDPKKIGIIGSANLWSDSGEVTLRIHDLKKDGTINTRRILGYYVDIDKVKKVNQ